MKKLLSFVASLLCVFMMMSPVSAISKKTAKSIAKKYVPSGYTYKSAHKDGNTWEVKYKKGKFTIEVDVSDKTKKVKEVDKNYSGKAGGTSWKISKSKAKSLVKAKFKGAKIIEVDKESSKKDGKYWEVEFKTSKYKGEAKVNASNGKIYEYEKDYR